MAEKNQKISTPEHISALYFKYLGLRNEQIADLRIFLEKPIGVGDHENVSSSVEKIIQKIDDYDSICSTVKNLFPNIQDELFGQPQSNNKRKKPASPSPSKEKPQKNLSKFGNSSEMFYNLQEDEKITIDNKNKTIISQQEIEDSEG